MRSHKFPQIFTDCRPGKAVSTCKQKLPRGGTSIFNDTHAVKRQNNAPTACVRGWDYEYASCQVGCTQQLHASRCLKQKGRQKAKQKAICCSVLFNSLRLLLRADCVGNRTPDSTAVGQQAQLTEEARQALQSLRNAHWQQTAETTCE